MVDLDNIELSKDKKINNDNIDSDIETLIKEEALLDNLNYLDNKKGLLNKYNSSSFDSFISIFKFSIKPYIDKNYNTDNY